LPSHIAELREGRFHLVHSAPAPIAADPYLTVTDLHADVVKRNAPAVARLRIVK
jgi:branched-chain amino acid transport system substrate-binding protein